VEKMWVEMHKFGRKTLYCFVVIFTDFRVLIV
jgi:hypothetical protein